MLPILLLKELLSLPRDSWENSTPIPYAFVTSLPASPPLHSSPVSGHHALLPFRRHTRLVHSVMPSLDSIWRTSTHFSRPYSHIPSFKKTSVTPQGPGEVEPTGRAHPGNRLTGPVLLKVLQAGVVTGSALRTGTVRMKEQDPKTTRRNRNLERPGPPRATRDKSLQR